MQGLLPSFLIKRVPSVRRYESTIVRKYNVQRTTYFSKVRVRKYESKTYFRKYESTFEGKYESTKVSIFEGIQLSTVACSQTSQTLAIVDSYLRRQLATRVLSYRTSYQRVETTFVQYSQPYSLYNVQGLYYSTCTLQQALVVYFRTFIIPSYESTKVLRKYFRTLKVGLLQLYKYYCTSGSMILSYESTRTCTVQ